MTTVTGEQIEAAQDDDAYYCEYGKRLRVPITAELAKALSVGSEVTLKVKGVVGEVTLMHNKELCLKITELTVEGGNQFANLVEEDD